MISIPCVRTFGREICEPGHAMCMSVRTPT
jgi:hypothetical protein